MPWGKRSVLSLRTEFVLFASQQGANIRALCRQFGIHPRTGYKWLERFTQPGPDALADRSRVPHRQPFANARSGLSPARKDQGHAMPAASTVHAILRRHGLHCRRQQMDFKGHFAVGNGRSHPLTILDDHSRFALWLQHCADEQRQTVQGQLRLGVQALGIARTHDDGQRLVLGRTCSARMKRWA